MKKNININLFGTIYAIDEDAYELLHSYLDSMKRYFGKQGGEEIADDIEHRVAEILWEQKQQGAQTVDIDTIRQIISNMGAPEEIGDKGTGAQSTTEAGKSAHADGKSAASDAGNATRNTGNAATNAASTAKAPRRLYRDTSDKIVAGVLSGLTRYFGWDDAIFLRLFFVLFLFLSMGYAILVYIILWVCVSPAQTAEDRLRMNGQAVTPESIKEELLRNETAQTSTDAAADKKKNGCLHGSLVGCGCLLLILLLPVILIIGIVFFAFILDLGGAMVGLGGLFAGLGSLATLGCLTGDWVTPNSFWDHTSSQTAIVENFTPQSGFNAIDMESVGTVLYTPADSFSVRIEGEEDMIALSHVWVNDSVLHIELLKESNIRQGLTYHISSPTLKRINLGGVGSIRSQGPIVGQSFRCKIEGVGSADLDVKVDSLFVDCEGVGTLTLKGETRFYKKDCEGIGKVKDKELQIIK